MADYVVTHYQGRHREVVINAHNEAHALELADAYYEDQKENESIRATSEYHTTNTDWHLLSVEKLHIRDE